MYVCMYVCMAVCVLGGEGGGVWSVQINVCQVKRQLSDQVLADFLYLGLLH
jgi:hypothetical protein